MGVVISACNLHGEEQISWKNLGLNVSLSVKGKRRKLIDPFRLIVQILTVYFNLIFLRLVS